MKKYIIFDVDRTLVDSYEPELLSLQKAIEAVIGKKLSINDMSKLTSLPTNEFFKLLNLDDEEVSLIVKKWDKYFQMYETKCFPNLKEMIKGLSIEGYEFGVITSRTSEEYHELDKELEDVSDLIKVVVTSDLVKNPKPNIDSMTYFCNVMNCSIEDIIYIGDSKIDEEFSFNTGCTFIAALWENKELVNYPYACYKTENLINLIKEINKENSL